MGNTRPVKRRVVIVLEGRDPSDPTILLKAVADALRPNDVEIHVKASDAVADTPSRPDEQLETLARETAEEALDRKARKVKVARKASAPRLVQTGVLSRKCRQVADWMGRRIAEGWRFTAQVLPVVERVAKVYKDLSR